MSLRAFHPAYGWTSIPTVADMQDPASELVPVLAGADRGAFDPALTYSRGDIVQYNAARYTASRPGKSSTSTTTRTNSVPNPRMQNGRAGWSAGGNVSVAVDAPNSRVLLTTSALINAGVSLYLLSVDIPAAPGEAWSTSVLVSVPANGVAISVRPTLSFFPVSTTDINGASVTIQPGSSAVLTVANATCPAGKTGVRLVIAGGTGGVPSGATMYVSQPIVEKAAAAGSYFDGATADTTSVTYDWTGTADASPSTAATVTATNSLGVPGAAGSAWNLLVPALKPTRAGLPAAWSPTTRAHTNTIEYLCADRATLLSSGSATLYFSRNDAVSWTAAHTFTDVVQSAYEADDGEILVATNGPASGGTPFKLFRSTGWAAGPTTATWAQVFTATTPMAAPATWSWSSYGPITFVAEYGPKEGTAYSGQTVATGGNARYIYVSYDSGRTWAQFFDLNAWLSANGPGVTTGCHLHGIAFDPYWDRFWVTFGDDRNGIVYTDDMGATWQAAQFDDTVNGPWQSVNVIPLPQCVLFGSDSPPNGISRIGRTQGKHNGLYTMEAAFSLNNASTITHLCHTATKAGRPGEDAPVVFGFSPNVVAGKSRIITTSDGYTFTDLWTDTAADATAGLISAYGPTVRGNLIADNPTSGLYTVGPMPAY